jgi:hypothetical protein
MRSARRNTTKSEQKVENRPSDGMPMMGCIYLSETI